MEERLARAEAAIGSFGYGAAGNLGTVGGERSYPIIQQRQDSNGYVKLTTQEYDDLMANAVRASGQQGGVNPDALPRGESFVADVVKVVEVPVIEDVRVGVTGFGVEKGMTKKTVKTKQMVPVERYKEVEETAIETQEEVVTDTRMVWKQVPEEYSYVVKKPVPVTRKKMVPFTDYEEREVEMEVDVPTDKKVEVDGYRIDQRLKGKRYEVKQKEVYEMRPVRVGVEGDMRVKDLSGGESFGTTKVGAEVFPSLRVDKVRPNVSAKSGWSGSLEDGLTSTQRQRVRDGTLDMGTLQATRVTSNRPGARSEHGWDSAAYVSQAGTQAQTEHDTRYAWPQTF